MGAMIKEKITLTVVLAFFICVNNCWCGVIEVTSEDEKECKNAEDCYDRRLHPFTIGSNFKSSIFIPKSTDSESENEFWLNNGRIHVEEQLNKTINENVAKNVIFFIGDGMSLTTLAAARAYMGGEEKSLSFEKFPYTGLVRTYCLDKKTPDSASTSTAYLSGVKANYGTIGVNGHVSRKDCSGMMDEKKHTQSIGSWSLDAGKAVGFVTTTRITHASPAGLYAHTADRDWENDAIAKKDCNQVKVDDIAYQLVYGEVGHQLSVALGGGRREFCDRFSSSKDKECLRTDGRYLKDEWLMANKSENRTYVNTREQLLAVDPKKTDRLLGMFQDSHMLYHLEAKEKGVDQPTLEEMTKKAIEVLQKNEKGFFLFVEGGKIDLAHHSVYAKIAFDETAELSKAVEAARAMTDEKDTLIVVSSDHSHTMSLSGYPKRHQDILGTAKNSDVDKLPYMTVNYANGMAFNDYFNTEKNQRNDPTTVNRDKVYSQYPSTVPLETETHGGEDVAVFASGPWAHLFTGVYEQNVLPHLMAFASCVGEGFQACDE